VNQSSLSFFSFLTVGATALLLACSDDPEPTPAETPDSGSAEPTSDAGSGPAAPADAVTLATISACPQVDSHISTSEWTACLIGKRAIGKDALTGVPCELRFKADGVFEYVKNGVSMATPPKAQWKLPTGIYLNMISMGNRQFIGSLSMDSAVDTDPNHYGVKLNVTDSPSYPDQSGLNEATAQYTLADGISEETCKLDYL
jgi:hypothetical protein